MSADANKRVVRRLLDELVNRGRAEVFDELVGPDYYDHDPLPGTPPDRDGLRRRLAIRHEAFPDFRADILNLIEEDDKVAVLMTGSGTHLGDFLGAPPSGKKFTILEMHLFRVSNGALIEHWGITDLFSLLVQLGLVVAPWDAGR